MHCVRSQALGTCRQSSVNPLLKMRLVNAGTPSMLLIPDADYLRRRILCPRHLTSGRNYNINAISYPGSCFFFGLS